MLKCNSTVSTVNALTSVTYDDGLWCIFCRTHTQRFLWPFLDVLGFTSGL